MCSGFRSPTDALGTSSGGRPAVRHAGQAVVIDPLLLDGYLVRAAERSPERVAVSDATCRLTYAQLDDQVTRLARGLESLGVGPGDRLAVLMQNSIEMALVLLAAPRLGAIAAPINIRLTPAEV